MGGMQSNQTNPRSVSSWIRQNVIEAAPLWLRFYRTACANVRVR
jgi:hypothetical protein